MTQSRIGWKRTIWFRLTAGSIAIVLVANTILSLLVTISVGRMLINEVQTRVRLDLNSARNVYDMEVENICLLLRATSARRAIPAPLESWNRDDLERLLENIRTTGELDMVSLLDREGRVIYPEGGPGAEPLSVSGNPIVARALANEKCFRGTVLVPVAELERMGCEKDLPREAAPEGKAMIMGAAVALVDLQRGGKCVGLLYGAKLLNRNEDIVDEMKDELYQDETYQGMDLGAATIFQDDVRISTSMRRRDGSRMVDTLMSPVVHDIVIEEKDAWSGRALVVDNWYITAYDPIVDPDGQVIGTLGVGVLEAPFVHSRRLAIGVFLGIMVITSLASLLLLTLATRSVLRPIGRIVSMSKSVVAGDLSARVGVRPSGEMGMLCRAIDQMAEAVSMREEALEQAARHQIGQSEKLASVGRMAAGIAHEINNPLTGLLTMTHLLKEGDGLDEKSRGYLDLMYKETSRMREIVVGLLNFSRESSAEMERLDINGLIEQSLALLSSHKEFEAVVIEHDLDGGLPEVRGDPNQIQQVLVNLSMNACEAMPGGGRLSISTFEKDGRVIVQIEDTGMGIEAEYLDVIFDPFFTTKPVGKGTGLGLSVSYGIVHQHGGTMEVESSVGEGTRFTIGLPAVPGGSPED